MRVDTSLLGPGLLARWEFPPRAHPLPKWTQPQPERMQFKLDVWLHEYEQARIVRNYRNNVNKANLNKRNLGHGYRRGVGKAVLQAVRAGKRGAQARDGGG